MARLRRPSLAAVISYCGDDERFIRANVDQAARCAVEVVVAVADRRFDGGPEDEAALARVMGDLPEARFVRYDLDRTASAHRMHNQARIAGLRALRSAPDLVAFLDADEILDGVEVGRWLDRSVAPRLCNAVKLRNYWYFRSPRHRALATEDSVVIARRSSVNPASLDTESERDGIYAGAAWPRCRDIVGRRGAVMVHHYSWVRTREQMLRKVSTWGHRDERDWVSLVEQEFSAPFQGIDFVHGYRYIDVEPFVEV